VQVSRGTVGKYKDGKIGANIERLQRIMTVAGYRLVLEKIPPKEDIFRKDRRLPPPAMD
jgi:predicted transcriptional regulator